MLNCVVGLVAVILLLWVVGLAALVLLGLAGCGYVIDRERIVVLAHPP